MQILPEEWRKLSHRLRRCHVNRERRRHRRRTAAFRREAEREAIESQPEYLEELCAEEKRLADEERRCEAKSMLENAAWLKREWIAQEEFRKKKEAEEKRRKEKEERERLIREEWEALQQKEKKEQEARDKERLEKEERLQEALSVVKKPPIMGLEEPWRNPLAPEGSEVAKSSAPTSSSDYGTERDTENCAFYLKTGACRFGDRCSRKHPRLLSSCTLMIPSMYTALGLREEMLNERDQDVALEYDEKDVYEDFKNFFDDALPEFSKAGKVVQFKVSCNHEAHLRGNIYVQYSKEEECCKAFGLFNGRWYAQKQLSCKFCPIKKWKNAICGLYNQKRCPKGRNCNFLHVFPNPDGAFSRADRDLPPLSPPHERQSSPMRRNSDHYIRDEERHSRRSKSRDRYHSRRSKSRERHYSRRSRSRERSSHKSRRSSYYLRSKSRERSPRSHSKERSERKKTRRFKSHSRSRSDSKSPYYTSHSGSTTDEEASDNDTSRGRHTRKKKRHKERSSLSSSGRGKKKHHHKSKKKHSKRSP